MVNELKRVLLDLSKNGSFLLINKFVLFQYSEGICSVYTRAMALEVARNDHVPTLFLTSVIFSVKSQGARENKRMNIEQRMVNALNRVLLDLSKNGSFLLINKFVLFQHSEGICSVYTRAMVLKVAQNDHVPTLFLTRIKCVVK